MKYGYGNGNDGKICKNSGTIFLGIKENTLKIV